MFILVLLFRPSGLFGERDEDRAPILLVLAALAAVPLVTSSNVVLNFSSWRC